MNAYTNISRRKQWYHVICALHRSRALLKIPATARFCERAVIEACSATGWTIDTVAVSPREIKLLVLAPAGLARDSMIRTIQHLAAAAVRRSRVIPPGHKVWGESAWCFAIRNDAALNAVRNRLVSISASGPSQHRRAADVHWPNPLVF